MKISIEQLKKIIKEEISNTMMENLPSDREQIDKLYDPTGEISPARKAAEEEQKQQKTENRQNIERVVSKMFPGVKPEIVAEEDLMLDFDLKDFDVFLQKAFPQMPIESFELKFESFLNNFNGDCSLIVQLAGLEEAKKPSAGMSKKRKK